MHSLSLSLLQPSIHTLVSNWCYAFARRSNLECCWISRAPSLSLGLPPVIPSSTARCPVRGCPCSSSGMSICYSRSMKLRGTTGSRHTCRCYEQSSPDLVRLMPRNQCHRQRAEDMQSRDDDMVVLGQPCSARFGLANDKVRWGCCRCFHILLCIFFAIVVRNILICCNCVFSKLFVTVSSQNYLLHNF